MYCQLVYLRGCHPGRIRHALTELPETLDETYERTLREINKADWELAHRLLQCVTVASRPLQVEELSEFLAFDFTAGPIPEFHEGWRLDDPVEAVLSTCSTLLAVVNVDGSAVIQFSHFSVKEFLTSTRLAEADDQILRRYTVSMTPAHTLVAQACLGILLHLDESITVNALKTYYLAEYAARHWFEHARFESVAQHVEDGMIQLFDPKKPHFAIWVWICDPRNPSMDSERAERPSQPGGTPLHYAAVCGVQEIVKYLAIEYSRDLHSRGFDNGSTALHVASTYGHLEVAQILVECGMRATARNNSGCTPLHDASSRGHVEVVRLLIKHGADATAGDNEGWTALHLASIPGHIEVARFLVEHVADTLLAVRDFGGSVPLHLACTHGHTELVEFFVEHGADATVRNNGGWTPLHDSAMYGRTEAARILLKRGTDPTPRSNDERTPLHLASSYGQMEAARALVEYGADVMARADDGQSSLHVASIRGNVVVARVLVENGADVTARDHNGWTPLHGAAFCGSVEMTRFLIENGTDGAARDNHGSTPYEIALRKGHVEVARFLSENVVYPTTEDDDDRWTPSEAATEEDVDSGHPPVEQGQDLATWDNNGWTPLHVAVEQGNTEIANVLIEHGADATAQAKNGWTPLHVAAEQGNVELARILIEHGADASAQGHNGRTPLHMAVEGGNLELVRILVGQGTNTNTMVQPAQGHWHRYIYPLAFFLVVGMYFQFM